VAPLDLHAHRKCRVIADIRGGRAN